MSDLEFLRAVKMHQLSGWSWVWAAKHAGDQELAAPRLRRLIGCGMSMLENAGNTPKVEDLLDARIHQLEAEAREVRP